MLLGNDMAVSVVLRADNVAANPCAHFEIDPAVLITAHKQTRSGGPGIIGYFHSHPNGFDRPSATDAEHAAADGKYWLIIAGGTISAWLPVAQERAVRRFEPILLAVQG